MNGVCWEESVRPGARQWEWEVTMGPVAGVLGPGRCRSRPGSLSGARDLPGAGAAGGCWCSGLLMAVICTLNIEYLPHYSS